MTREETLDTAKALVCGDRAKQYGPPQVNFTRIANMWAAYKGVEFTPGDVAAMLVLLKVARAANSSQSADTWIDIAGYAACGAEVTEAV